MKSNYEKCLDIVLKHEGGFVNHPKDPGGATNRGITKRVLEAWLKREVTIDEVKNLSLETAQDIYKKQYWKPVKGNQLPAGEISFNIGAFQVGPASFNSHILEKSYTHFTNGSSELSKIGMQNHWDNMKFRYLGPNSDLAHWTLEDSINNNISTQFGMGGASSLVIT